MSKMTVMMFCNSRFLKLFIHTHTHTYIYIYIYIYTGCPSRNVPDFGRVFLMLKYTDITPKHLCPKLNGYRDNGQRSLKL